MPPTLYTCSVVGARAGPQGVVALTEVGGEFRQQWFYVPEAMRREILAVALAAMSTGRQVDALVDPPGEHTMQCYELGVVIGFPVIESPEQRRRHEEEQRKREEEQRKREEEQRKREEEAERRTREAEERRGRP